MRTPGLILASLLLLTIGASAAAAEVQPRSLRGADSLEGPLVVTRVPGGKEVAVLIGDPPMVRMVEPGGRLGRAQTLELTPAPKQLRPLKAARSSFGDWLISAGTEVRWLRGSKDEPLPLPPLVAAWDVGFLRDRPVAAVVWRSGEDNTVPLILEWTGRKWEALLFETVPEEAMAPGPLTQHLAALLAGGSGDSLWLAFNYRHRVLRVSGSGKLDLEMEVGDARVDRGPDDPEAERRLAEDAARLGGPPGRRARATVFVNTARPAIDALAEGPDGRLYLIVASGEAGDSRALERFDPMSGAVDRTDLRIPTGFPVRMVAGGDGLVIAASAGKNGAWLLPWEAIDQAAWTRVDNALVTPPPIEPARTKQGTGGGG